MRALLAPWLGSSPRRALVIATHAHIHQHYNRRQYRPTLLPHQQVHPLLCQRYHPLVCPQLLPACRPHPHPALRPQHHPLAHPPCRHRQHQQRVLPSHRRLCQVLRPPPRRQEHLLRCQQPHPHTRRLHHLRKYQRPSRLRHRQLMDALELRTRISFVRLCKRTLLSVEEQLGPGLAM